MLAIVYDIAKFEIVKLHPKRELYFFRVNWICAIIISPFLKRVITSRETMLVPLQFTRRWKYAIMYV